MKADVAIVTGGAGRMGSAVVRRLARNGVTVVVFDAHAEQAATVCDEIVASGGLAEPVVVDLADLGAVRTAVDAVVAKHGRIDMLCNSAGGVGPRSQVKAGPATWVGQMFWESDPAHWTHMVTHNLYTCMNMCHAVLPHMIKRKRGRILNWVTGTVQSGRRGVTAYAASKGAVLAFTKALAKEAGPHGVTVNDISFGEHGEWPGACNEYFEPGGRATTPEDVADVAAFLLSDDARWLSAQSVCASGGQFPR